MYRRIFVAMLLAAISCTLFACKAQNPTVSSVGSSSSMIPSLVSSRPATSSNVVSSGTTSSSVVSSGTTSSIASSPTTKPADKKVFTKKETEFVFKDGVYHREYGNRVVFVVTKDPSSLDDKAMNSLAKSTAGDYYKNDYYCTVCFVKPDKKDGTFDITSKKSDNSVATVFAMHHPDIKKITINLKEVPLQDYIDKQFEKATIKEIKKK